MSTGTSTMRLAIHRYIFPLIALLGIGATVLAALPTVKTSVRDALVAIKWDLNPAFDGANKVGALRQQRRYTDALQTLEASAKPKAGSQAAAQRELLLGTLLLDLDRPDEAIPHLSKAHTALPILRDVVALKLGKAVALSGDPVQASSVYRAVPATSPYYQRALREAIALDLERNSSAQALLSIGRLLGNDDLSTAPVNLLILAGEALEDAAHGNMDDLRAAVEIYQIVISRYPTSSQSTSAKNHLADLKKSKGLTPRPPEFEDRYAAARGFMGAHLNVEASARLEDLLAELKSTDDRRCDVAMDLARSMQKQRRHTDSLVPLAVVDSDLCPHATRVKAVYLTGRAYSRKGSDQDAIKTYGQLRERYPEHSMADDAYLLEAAIHQDNKKDAEAEALLREQLDKYPNGDMASEGSWRLAWSLYQQKRIESAVDVLSTFLQTADNPKTDDLLRARYWQAWWSHKIKLDGAESVLKELATTAPTHYYGLMAARRLKELDASAYKKLVRPAAIGIGAPIRSITPSPQGEGRVPQRAALLYQSGLRKLAIAELATLEHSEGSNSQRLNRAYLFGDMNVPHPAVGTARHYLEGSRLTAVNDKTLDWWLIAYPLPFDSAVLKYTEPNKVDPLLLWALMREESNFNPSIRSWAGATGLAQLMWPTAKETAGKIGISIRKSDLSNPTTNIRLGAKYLGGLLGRFDGQAGLAVPSYNAGPGAVNRWLKGKRGDDFDLWVENIPYKQTRDYVKRVLGSYQTYHYLYRPEKDPFLDLKTTLP